MLFTFQEVVLKWPDWDLRFDLVTFLAAWSSLYIESIYRESILYIYIYSVFCEMCTKCMVYLNQTFIWVWKINRLAPNSHLLQASGMLPGWQTFSRLCFSSYIMEVCRFQQTLLCKIWKAVSLIGTDVEAILSSVAELPEVSLFSH